MKRTEAIYSSDRSNIIFFVDFSNLKLFFSYYLTAIEKKLFAHYQIDIILIQTYPTRLHEIIRDWMNYCHSLAHVFSISDLRTDI